MNRIIPVSETLYERLEAEARRRGINSVEELLEGVKHVGRHKLVSCILFLGG